MYPYVHCGHSIGLHLLCVSRRRRLVLVMALYNSIASRINRALQLIVVGTNWPLFHCLSAVMAYLLIISRSACMTSSLHERVCSGLLTISTTACCLATGTRSVIAFYLLASVVVFCPVVLILFVVLVRILVRGALITDKCLFCAPHVCMLKLACVSLL